MDSNADNLNASSLSFIEGLYADFIRDPQSVEPSWREYFAEFARHDPFANRPKTAPTFRPPGLFACAGLAEHDGQDVASRARTESAGEIASLQERVDQLVHAYRVRGHLIAHLDPLGMARPHPPELELEYHGLTESDLDRPFSTEAIQGADVLTLRDILARLRNSYCRS